MSISNTPRLIEVDFPLKEVSAESVREKNIRHGHISTLHIWWARRPLAAITTDVNMIVLAGAKWNLVGHIPLCEDVLT